MASMPKTKKDQPKIEVEPGAEKRLASILKKALNTPPKRAAELKAKQGKASASHSRGKD